MVDGKVLRIVKKGFNLILWGGWTWGPPFPPERILLVAGGFGHPSLVWGVLDDDHLVQVAAHQRQVLAVPRTRALPQHTDNGTHASMVPPPKSRIGWPTLCKLTGHTTKKGGRIQNLRAWDHHSLGMVTPNGPLGGRVPLLFFLPLFIRSINNGKKPAMGHGPPCWKTTGGRNCVPIGGQMALLLEKGGGNGMSQGSPFSTIHTHSARHSIRRGGGALTLI